MFNVNKKEDKSMNTLKKAVYVSVFGAIISGIVAHMGSSMTVFMDFCRCLLEGITTVITYIVFTKIDKGIIDKKDELKWKENIRLITGVVMICTSILLAIVSIMTFSPIISEGNNLPSLVTTSICVCINFRIYRNYKKVLNEKFDHIIKAQYAMYRVKTCVNAFVLFIIQIMIFAPSWSAIAYIDLFGTCLISLLMLSEGIKNIKSVKVICNTKTVSMVKKIVSFVTSI